MTSDNGRETGEMRRRARLAASLRENLKRRKAQQRGRASETGTARDASAPSPRETSPPASGDHEA